MIDIPSAKEIKILRHVTTNGFSIAIKKIIIKIRAIIINYNQL